METKYVYCLIDLYADTTGYGIYATYAAAYNALIRLLHGQIYADKALYNGKFTIVSHILHEE